MKKVLVIILVIVSVISCFSVMAGAEEYGVIEHTDKWNIGDKIKLGKWDEQDIVWTLWNIDDGTGYFICDQFIDLTDYTSVINMKRYVDNNPYEKDGVTAKTTSPTYKTYSDEDYTHYYNEWEFSGIRSVLNGDFFNTAFNENEKMLINKTVVNGWPSNGHYMSTEDYVYVPSLDDALKISSLVANNQLCFDHCVALRDPQGDVNVGYAEVCTASNYKKYLKINSGGYSLSLSGIYAVMSVTIGDNLSALDKAVFHTTDGCRTIYKRNDGTIFATKKQSPHDYEKSIIRPTCTSQGYSIYKCKCCGCSYTAEITAKINHDYAVSVLNPTCTAGGYTSYACKSCGYSYKDTYTNKVSHNLICTVIPPTCSDIGYTLYSCTGCDYKYKAEYVYEYATHNWVNIETKDSTCMQNGYTRMICSDCLLEETVTLKLNPHEYEETKVEPKCSNYGYTVHTCKSCGYSYYDNYDYTISHNYKEVVVEKTCTTDGYTANVCVDCGSYYIVSTDSASHTYEYSYERIGDSCYGAYVIGVCTVCGEATKSKYGITYVWEHEYEDTVVPASFENQGNGYIIHTCKYCKNSCTEKLPYDETFKCIKGDLDNDKCITVSDARNTLRIAVGIDKFDKFTRETISGDYNSDGIVSVGDARSILRVAIGIE